MIPTVYEEKRSLFGAENTRATTIEMAKGSTAEDESVLWRGRLRAQWARRGLLFHHRSTSDVQGEGSGDATWAGRQLASTRMSLVVGELLDVSEGRHRTRRSW